MLFERIHGNACVVQQVSNTPICLVLRSQAGQSPVRSSFGITANSSAFSSFTLKLKAVSFMGLSFLGNGEHWMRSPDKYVLIEFDRECQPIPEHILNTFFQMIITPSFNVCASGVIVCLWW